MPSSLSVCFCGGRYTSDCHSSYTGILMCDFSEVHKYIEKLLGRPVWTHELASEALWSEIKEKAKPDFHKIIEP